MKPPVTADRDRQEDDEDLDRLDHEDEHQEEEEQHQDTEVEARARRMGWTPESEWDEDRAKREGKRKPAKFLTAEEYIERVESDIPILRERNRFLDGELAKTNKKLDDIGKLVESLHRSNKAISQREYERGKADAMAARRQAIEEADVAGVEKADEALQALEKARTEAEDSDPAKGREEEQDQGNPDTKAAIAAWVEKNPWFHKDRVLHEFAKATHSQLIEEQPGVPEEDLLPEVERMTRERFPEKFGVNPRRKEPGRVDRPSPPGNARGASKTMRDVPAEDRAAFRRHQEFMKERGVDYTEEEFLAGYKWS